MESKNNVHILDCTLRDGGYVNDWHFGNRTISSVVLRLDSAGIDSIEVGFLDASVQFDRDRSIYPNIQSIERTLGNSLPRQAKLVAMINLGAFPKERLIPQEKSLLDGIRLYFRKPQLSEAIEFGREIMFIGYKLFLNPGSLSSYHDSEVNELIEKSNALKPEAISIVDSFGLMYKTDLLRYATIFDNLLEKPIALGFHAHNNLQMANANCLDFINHKMERIKVVDSSILGMGRNAGNACTELILSYIEKNNTRSMDLDQILECAYTDIYRLYNKPAWGYHLEHMISAIHDCPPTWVKYLMDKYTLSIKDIRSILSSLPFERRLTSYFSKDLAEQKYIEYMNNFIDDDHAIASIKNVLSDREILIICPGKTIKSQHDSINNFIKQKRPLIITVNFVSDDYRATYLFISNAIRYSKMLGDWHEIINKPALMLTSNITPADTMRPDYLFNYKARYEKTRGDNSVALLLSLLQDLGIHTVFVAGLDGFDEQHPEENYYSSEMSLPQTRDTNTKLVEQLSHVLSNGKMKIKWITPSLIEQHLENIVSPHTNDV
ncbi:MAG: aldolase catalytic domain-containing protein [Holophagaceae bacterium]|nr:aldolase catalytic domain-containing protein [Holophagaceae bacterium]